MLKKIALASAFTLSAIPVLAQTEFKVDLKEVDTNKYCVYDKGVYSVGSVVQMGDELRECKFYPTNINGVPPGARWSKVN